MLDALSQVFLTNTRALEALYVINGLKPVARMSFSENYVPVIRNFCQNNNLAFETSDFKIMMNFKGNYSTKGSIVPADDSVAGHLFVYISMKDELAGKAKQAEAKQNVGEFGRLLGYPSCCVDFFKRNKPDEEKKSNDYVVPAMANSRGNVFSYYNNIFGRYFDLVLLSHCPCSFDCKKSIGLARKHEETISNYDGELKERIKRFLKSAVIYRDGAVYLMNNYVFDNKTVRFLNITATKRDDFYDLLSRNRKINANEHHFLLFE
ncbi:hypothetical protein JXA85_01895 [Candidatus Woesearchaeota archaeon]|nr:hypothetical protein [Candidatus Woesearchaeota archaeon]